MKNKKLLAILISLISLGCHALDFSSNELIFKSIHSLDELASPIYHVQNSENFSFNFIFGQSNDLVSTYEDLDSKNAEKINNRLNQIYAEPQFGQTKLWLQYKFTENISLFTNHGYLFQTIVENPVFPEAELRFSQFTSFGAKHSYKLRNKVQVDFSYALSLQKNYNDTVSSDELSFSEEKPFDLNKEKIHSGIDLTSKIFIPTKYLRLENAIYSSTFKGERVIQNFMGLSSYIRTGTKNISDLNLFANYLTFEKQELESNDRVRAGASVKLFRTLNLSTSFSENANPHYALSLKTSHFNLGLSYFKQTYKEFDAYEVTSLNFTILM